MRSLGLSMALPERFSNRMNVLESYPRLVPFSRTQEEFKLLEALGKEQDDHGCFYPTEVIVKDDKPVGWISVGAMPTMLAWFSTKHLKVRDSLQLINTIECMQRRLGAPAMLMPCRKDSPFYKYFEKIGYQTMGDYTLFLKEFNNVR
jgi:hypothetical protein